MPRLIPDATILIRGKGKRKWNKIEVFHVNGVYPRVRLKGNNKWIKTKSGDIVSMPWYNLRDLLWKSIGKKFIRGGR